MQKPSFFTTSYISMISHSNCNFLMDWEPESYGMDVDDKGPVDVPIYITQEFLSADCDVYMAPITIQEVHMASPMLTSQPPTISEINCSTFFLPPLDMITKPIVFPPFNIHAVSRQALEPRVSPRKIKAVPLDDSPPVYTPAVATYHAESCAMASASPQGDTYTSAVHNHDHFPSNFVYRPVTPSPSKSRPTPQDVSPISMPVMPIDILEIGDTRAATLSPLIEGTSSARWPDRMADPGDIAPNVVCTPLPDCIDEQDVTPSTPHPVEAETNTPEWTVDEDATPLSPILETTTLFRWPEITISQEYVDWGVDLIDLSSLDFDSSNSDKDDSVIRAFGGSSLEDLDWILDGFRAASVTDTCIEPKNTSKSFEAMLVPTPLHNFSPVSPYDWAVSDAGLDLISFDSTHDLRHNIHSGSFELPSFNSGDVIQTESNELLRLSTPASPNVQSRSPFDSLVVSSKAAYTVEINASRSTKTDASTQTEELPGATYSLRPSRRYSPYVRYSPYRKLSRDFTFGSSGSGDLESASAQLTITSSTSCGLPSPPVDNVFLDCSNVQAPIISEFELEPIPAVCVNAREPEEDDQEKEMTFPGAYPIEQVVYALDEPAKLPARHFVKVAQKNHFETKVFPCPTVHPSAQYGFKELFFGIFAHLFDW